MTNQFTCLPCACKTWIYFLLGYYIFFYSCGVFLCFQPSSVNNHHLVALLLLLGQEGSTLAEHLAIRSRVSSTTPTLCGNLMSPSFPFDLGGISGFYLLPTSLNASANDITQSSSTAKDTVPRDKLCPNETIAANEISSSKTTLRKSQDGGGPGKKRPSGSHTKSRASCSLIQRHQTPTRPHPHTRTEQSPSTSYDVPAIYSQFAYLMLRMQRRQLETLTSLFPNTSTRPNTSRANDTDEDSGVSPAKIGRKNSASTHIATPAELSGPTVDPEQPAESLDDLEALVKG